MSIFLLKNVSTIVLTELFGVAPDLYAGRAQHKWLEQELSRANSPYQRSVTVILKFSRFLLWSCWHSCCGQAECTSQQPPHIAKKPKLSETKLSRGSFFNREFNFSQPWLIVMAHRPLYCSNKSKKVAICVVCNYCFVQYVFFVIVHLVILRCSTLVSNRRI